MRALGAEPRSKPPWDPAPEAAPGWGPSPTVTADLPSSPNPPEKGASIPVPVPQPAVPVPREQHQASLAGLTMTFICSHARRNGGPGPGQCTWNQSKRGSIPHPRAFYSLTFRESRREGRRVGRDTERETLMRERRIDCLPPRCAPTRPGSEPETHVGALDQESTLRPFGWWADTLTTRPRPGPIPVLRGSSIRKETDVVHVQKPCCAIHMPLRHADRGEICSGYKASPPSQEHAAAKALAYQLLAFGAPACILQLRVAHLRWV